MTITQDDVATAVAALLDDKKSQYAEAESLNARSLAASSEYEKRLFDLQAQHQKQLRELHSSYLHTLSDLSAGHRQILTSLCKLDDQIAMLLDKHIVNTHA